MINPYEVMGIAPTASDVEIRAAYRTLMKKYHPDNFANDPELCKIAEMRSRDINEAMHMIKTLRSEGAGKGVWVAESENDDYIKFPANKYFNDEVRNAINESDLNRADSLLLAVPENERDAEWWFCYAIITKRRGWEESALKYIKRACEMAPNDMEFDMVRAAMESGRNSIAGTSKRIAGVLIGTQEPSALA